MFNSKEEMKFYSFDIFDTCFVRACGCPKNVFDLLAYRILGDDSHDSARYDFAHIRIEGENKARKSFKDKEISLKDIYEHCDFSGLTDLPNEKIWMTEMAIEKELLVPVYSTLEKIRKIHQQGNAVCYISDMYLPYGFILELLKGHGFWQDYDRLYVSSACGFTKFSGDLYTKVKDENDLSYRKWRHWGDNKYSDYIVPIKKGIHAKLIRHEESFYERFLLRQDYFPGFFVNQHLAGISKAVRLSFPDTPQYAFAADLVAPLYVPFVYKVLSDATHAGIRRIFFLARDGYILYQTAQALRSEFPNMELKYLYVSRSSLYLPGLDAITPETLYSLTKTEFGFTNENKIEILSNFIVPETLEEIKQVSLANPDEDIFSNRNVLDILSRYHKEQQCLIFEYFTQEGVADVNSKNAIVDVRGSRLCHQVINTLLSKWGYLPVKGYYLEVLKSRKSIQEAGDYESFFFDERFKRNSLRCVSELGDIFEQYFSLSPHYRTIAYKKIQGIILPVFEEKEIEDIIKTTTKAHVEVMAFYSKLFISNKLYLHLCSVLFLCTELLNYFSQKPTYRYLLALYPIKINNQRNKVIHIVKSVSLNSLKNLDISWWRGSVYYMLKTTCCSEFINAVFFTVKKIYRRTILNKSNADAS